VHRIPFAQLLIEGIGVCVELGQEGIENGLSRRHGCPPRAFEKAVEIGVSF